MANDGSAAHEKTAGLARIRDNQRRSRARRKEYITELEDKNKYCEQLGVEASIELQSAARLVMAENYRLRALLKRLGYTDADIDRECSETKEQSPSDVVQELLSNRRSCRPGSKPAAAQSQTSEQDRNNEQYATTKLVPRPAPLSEAVPFSMISPTSAASSTAYISPAQAVVVEASGTIDLPSAARSCRDAAGMLRSLHPDLGQELEEQLGCGFEQSDCNVSNEQIFQVLDRYG